METASSLFHTNNTPRGQNGNFTSFAWANNITNTWERDLNTTTTAPCTTSTYYNHFDSFHHHATAFSPAASSYHALLYGGGGSQNHPDPHLMCLKLGKRNYFEDATGRHVTGFSISKRGKTYYSGGGVGPDSATVPKCQVEGCHVALLNVKEYHRRHKVCEVHSKAPKVVVLGLEQRFCQQCSRFHVVTEFDDTKRSCRRRLAGHNERRRKTCHEHSTPTPAPSQGHALSLLSSRNESLISSPDLSSRCSAALQELIAENRAALLGKQLVVEKEWPIHHAVEDINRQQDNHSSNHQHHFVSSNQHHIFSEPQGWDRFDEQGTNNVTLDLMQAPTSAFELLSMKGKTKEEERVFSVVDLFWWNKCSLNFN